MNRLASTIPPRKTASLSGRNATIQGGRFRAIDDDLGCAVWTPLHYEPKYAYPLLVWLHGAGDDESQLKRIMMHVDARNYVAMAPRGPLNLGPDSAEGFDWPLDDGHLALAEERVTQCVHHVANQYRVHPDRVFLAGYGAGGTMAYRLALTMPRSVAGVLSVAGAFPRIRAPLGRLNEVRRLPVFMATALECDRYPPEQACDDLRLFHSAGLSITLRQYSGRHVLTTQMLADMNRWLMEHICGPSAPDDEE